MSEVSGTEGLPPATGRAPTRGVRAGRSSRVAAELDDALVRCLTEGLVDSVDELTPEIIATHAGVSRTSAYRHFKDRDGLLVRATTLLTEHHVQQVRDEIAPLPTVLDRWEHAFVYVAREVAHDNWLRLLMTSMTNESVRSGVRQAGIDVMYQHALLGQRTGEVRSDISVDELMVWTNQQQGLLAALALSVDEARRWFQLFVKPAITGPGAGGVAVGSIRVLLDQASETIDRVRHELDGPRNAGSD